MDMDKKTNIYKINKEVKIRLLIGILISVAFVVGIPMIPLGAVFKWWAMMAIGIAFVGFGFYAIPIFWTNFGKKVTQKRIVFAVEREHLLTVQEISAQLSMNERQIRGILDECFRKGYLNGYIRRGDSIFRNEAVAPEDKVHAVECIYCGAKFTYKGLTGICPYCGSAHKEKPKEK